MRRILIAGANGQLGSRLSEFELPLGFELIVCDRQMLDVTDVASIERALDSHRPDVIVNAAAFTAVDRAEEEAELARKINGTALQYLAERCVAHSVDLIHVSTDYVFDGNKNDPYQTDDEPSPAGVYGHSKWEGEKAVVKAFVDSNRCRFWIFRAAWLYDSRGQNFAQTIIRLGESGKSLKIVNDQWGAPAAAGPFAALLMQVAKNPNLLKSGTWHYGTSGPTTWYDFAQAIFEHKNLQVDTIPCSTGAYPTLAKRPVYSYLDPVPLMEALGRDPEDWKDQMHRIL